MDMQKKLNKKPHFSPSVSPHFYSSLILSRILKGICSWWFGSQSEQSIILRGGEIHSAPSDMRQVNWSGLTLPQAKNVRDLSVNVELSRSTVDELSPLGCATENTAKCTFWTMRWRSRLCFSGSGPSFWRTTLERALWISKQTQLRQKWILFYCVQYVSRTYRCY